tara:strand:- start:85 stop:552 length:468 start_codon:yes stop_codon:yes gene_type:complete
MKIEYKEEQKFTQWWLWIGLIGFGIYEIYNLYQHFIIGEKKISDLSQIIFSIVIFGVIVLFWRIRLNTKIDQNEIRMKFFPFVKKQIRWKDIKSAEIVNYGFVGGWGIRLWTKYGTVYNTKGNKGLAIELLNGKKILIGTQNETELNKVVENAIC